MSYLRQMRHGIAHDPVRRRDRTPAGAVPAGSAVTVTLRVDSSVRPGVHGAVLEVLDASAAAGAADGDPADGEGPAGAAAAFDVDSTDADSAAGDPVGDDAAGRGLAAGTEDRWVSIPMEPCEAGYRAVIDTAGEPRVLFYRFRVATDLGALYYVRRTDGAATAGDALGPFSGDGAGEGAGPHSPALPGFQLTVYDGAFRAPAWFSGSVMYQVFPDRFARGADGIRWDGVESHRRRGWPVVVHEDWNEPPAWGGDYDPVDFFGGSLAGIRQKLDYLVSLGVEVLYLNPVCEARSNHRYDTGDYEVVDPILGDWDDFEELARAAEGRGIRIVLDTVLSHTGAASRYFNLDGSYDSFGAAQGEGSPYRAWYDFGDYGDVGYRSWWGDPTLPEVDERDPSWQRFALGDAGHAGVLKRWVGHGGAGFRLDVADEIPDEVLELVRKAAKDARPDAVVIGEVWEDPTTKESYGVRRTYGLGRALDSVMNYPLRGALLSFGLGKTDARSLVTFLKQQRLNYPLPLYASLMNLLSSHDVERVRSVLAAGREFRDLPRDEQAGLVSSIDWEADARSAALQRLLATIVYALPGVPCLYYGDERGLQGGRDPFDRATFPWDGQRADCGQDLSWFYRGLGKLRQASFALRHGDAAFYSHGKDVVAVLRTVATDQGRSGTLLCVVNRSEESQSVVIDLVDPAAGLGDEDVLRVKYADAKPRCVFSTDGSGVASDMRADCEFGIFSCELGPMQGCVFHLGHGLDKPMEPGLGVLCHITSVPSAPGDGPEAEGSEADGSAGRERGTLGPASRRFVDWLADAGVAYWQILPLNPTDEHGSPYAGLSAFAGNTLLLDAGERAQGSAPVDEEGLRAFVARNHHWLASYGAFTAIKKLVGEVPWQQWPESYRTWVPGLENDPALVGAVRDEYRRQYVFERQWQALRAYANDRGVRIVGDMPIYVSADSADVWAHRDYFALDEAGYPALQGGMPPDGFAPQGQLWGNPTYRWDALRDSGYDWWLARLGRMFQWYDYVRIDHFLGFASYYAVPQGKGAQEGQWLPGPGFDLFRHAYERFGPLPLIAEDLGIITPEVRQLLAQTGLPGMDVVLFADGDPRTDWAPKRGKIAFTGTHDTPTLTGWARQRYCRRDDGSFDDDAAVVIARDLVDKAAGSGADVVVLPLQDVLGLGDDARMNVPGTTQDNWIWQGRQADIDAATLRLAALTRLHNQRP